FYPESPYPVISLLSEQEGVQEKGGTMRLGGYPCRLVEKTKARAAYGRDEVIERHRHRYELNNEFRAQLQEAGLVASGTLPDDSLVEICELRDHPWMVGSQFHPEFRSRPNRPHPLFDGFVAAALERVRARRLPRGRASHSVTGASRRAARSTTAPA
ncbi:MAG: hypothetical protein ACE1ZN_06360, partial [Dehalococcoidia bacterium]